MSIIAAIWFTIHTVIIISLIITVWYIYSQRPTANRNQIATDYLWNEFAIVMWILSVVLILYPLAIVWFLIELFNNNSQQIIQGLTKTQAKEIIKQPDNQKIIITGKPPSLQSATQIVSPIPKTGIDVPSNITALAPSTNFATNL